MKSYPTLTTLIESDHHGADVATFIRANCQPYLEENPTLAPMWRGVGGRHPPTFKYTVHDDRRPRVMSPGATSAWNSAITASGRVAHRTNSAMGTGDKSEATSFGRRYVLFPIGEFNYTWFPESKDANSHASVMRGKLARIMIPELPGNPRTLDGLSGAEIEEYRSRLDQRYHESLLALECKGDDGSLTDAIESGNEIMLRPAGGELFCVSGSLWTSVERHLRTMT